MQQAPYRPQSLEYWPSASFDNKLAYLSYTYQQSFLQFGLLHFLEIYLFIFCIGDDLAQQNICSS